MYKYKLPESGKTVSWRSLTVQEDMDIEGQYNRQSNQHQKKFMQLFTRIAEMDGKKPSFADFLALSSLDAEQFYNEVLEKEAIRRAQLRAALPINTSIDALENALAQFAIDMQTIATSAKDVLMSAKELDAASKDPLSQR